MRSTMRASEALSRIAWIPLRPHPASSVTLVLCLLFTGCSSSSHTGAPHHRGAKVNVQDFMNNTAAYKGKTLTLRLRVDEAVVRTQGQSLREYGGREAKFVMSGPNGENVNLVIAIPKGLSVPEVGYSEDVTVTFVCARGSLRQGNEARSIKKT